MRITALPNGEFQLEGRSLTRILSFLSPVAFRLRDLDCPASFAVPKLSVLSSGAKANGNRIEYESLRVEFDDELNFQVYVNDVKALASRPYKPAELTHDDVDIAKKEGHENGSADSSIGGLSFEFNGPVYGLGDKTGPLNKQGYAYINWNTDDPHPHVETFKSLYKSIPFLLLFKPELTVGLFFDNTSLCRFDIEKEDPNLVTYGYSGGSLDLYCFFGAMPDVVSDYTSLVGRNPLPPRWALGAQQSRWGYLNEHDVLEVVEGYRKADIPLSVIYLDIDYMDRYMDFTVDKSRFPDMAALTGKLAKEGVHLIPLIDAGVKVLDGYKIYDEGMENGYFSTLDGEVYHNEVWPGDSVFPAFINPKVQAWWSDKVADFLKETGIGGIENDMNEPASFKGPLPLEVEMGGLPHKLAHNVYGHCMDKATYEGFVKAGKRPYVITRAAYAGTSRYAGAWTGDNNSIYDHLRLSIPQLANLSLSGFANIGVDVGGFGGDCPDHLMQRFINASILSPVLRNHSSIGTRPQEPYAFDEKTAEIYRKAVMTRYELIPTIYDNLFLSLSSGLVVLRPLVYNFPEAKETYNDNSTIMLGESLLLAPSLMSGEIKRAVYLPDDFYSYADRALYKKGWNLIEADERSLNLFVRDHSILALNPVGTKTTDFQPVLRLLWTGNEAACYHYEDAGDGLGYTKGEYNLYLIQADEEHGLSIVPVHLGMPSHYKEVLIETFDGRTIRRDFVLKD